MPFTKVPLSEWIPDSRAPDCMFCDTQFTCFVRRHHCRYCGFVCCWACSGNQVEEERICDKCYAKYEADKARMSTLLASPALNRVKNLSPVVHRIGVAEPLGRSSRATSRTTVLDSPRISSSRQNLKMMYGSPLETKKTKKQAVPSSPSVAGAPLLSQPAKRKQSAAKFGPKDVMIVVDPFSTGAVVVAEILARGVKVIRLFSDKYPDHLVNLVLDGIKVSYVETVTHEGDLEKTLTTFMELQKKWNYIGCVAGCETGVEVADAVSEGLGLRTNGTAFSDARRNKFVMNERVRAAGIPAVRQARASTLPQIEQFLDQFGDTFKIVIKPTTSAGTDGVYVCRNKEETRRRFKELMGATNLLGKSNQEVVLQEFLEGKEYVIDTVSNNGDHRCTAIWEYDKRKANGGEFVYFGNRCKFDTWPKAQEMINYQFRVLDALGIKNGPGHGEVMLTPAGPRLVEVGSRCHGAEGNWVPLARLVFGYTQVDGTVDLYLDPEALKARPQMPKKEGIHGIKIDLVCWGEGKLKGFGRVQEIQALKSYVGMDMLRKPGDYMKPTVDCITTPGVVRLAHESLEQCEKDFEVVREIEKNGLFIFE